MLLTFSRSLNNPFGHSYTTKGYVILVIKKMLVSTLLLYYPVLSIFKTIYFFSSFTGNYPLSSGKNISLVMQFQTQKNYKVV